MKSLFAFFRDDNNTKKEIKDLKSQLEKEQRSFEESKKQLEKMIETVDNLVKRIAMAEEHIITLATHTAMMEIIISANHDSNSAFLRKSNDSLIN